MMKPMLEKPDGYFSKLKSATRRRWRKPRLDEIVRLAASGKRPDQVFDGVSDELWLWANTGGYRKHQALRDILAAVPDERTQTRFTGLKGDAKMIRAFNAY